MWGGAMSKRLDAMRSNPRVDWKISDVEAVCGEYGVECSALYTSRSSLPFSTRLWMPKMKRLEYPVVVEPLTDEDGGGFAASVPDLPGCMSDGETPEEALVNVQDAIAAWIEAALESGRPVLVPSRRLATA